jgi:hypothetical protein
MHGLSPAVLPRPTFQPRPNGGLPGQGIRIAVVKAEDAMRVVNLGKFFTPKRRLTSPLLPHGQVNYPP